MACRWLRKRLPALSAVRGRVRAASRRPLEGAVDGRAGWLVRLAARGGGATSAPTGSTSVPGAAVAGLRRVLRVLGSKMGAAAASAPAVGRWTRRRACTVGSTVSVE